MDSYTHVFLSTQYNWLDRLLYRTERHIGNKRVIAIFRPSTCVPLFYADCVHQKVWIYASLIIVKNVLLAGCKTEKKLLFYNIVKRIFDCLYMIKEAELFLPTMHLGIIFFLYIKTKENSARGSLSVTFT